MNDLDFKTALAWLQVESGLKLDAQSGQIRLRDAQQRELLMLESLEGGATTGLWAPIHHDLAPELVGRVGLHLLHLCADLEAMGPVKVARMSDTGRYLLVHAPAQAPDAASFVALCADMISMAKDIADGLAEIAGEIADDANTGSQAFSLDTNGLAV